MSKCVDEYEKFNEEYENLEVQPYNAAFDYYSNGWNAAIIAMSDAIKESIEKSGLSDLKMEKLVLEKFINLAKAELIHENNKGE